jgi:hypothetical protein
MLLGCDDLYMVGIAAICWAIWNTRNKITFDKYKMRTPCEVMFLSFALLMYWAGLQKEQGKEKLQFGASRMMEKHQVFFVCATETMGCLCPTPEWLSLEREDSVAPICSSMLDAILLYLLEENCGGLLLF